MKYVFVIAMAAAAFASTASAAPGGYVVPQSVYTEVSPEVTGSIVRTPDRAGSVGDLQGRDFRSSTRGNAQFPERAPEAQNLGNTSGGPEF